MGKQSRWTAGATVAWGNRRTAGRGRRGDPRRVVEVLGPNWPRWSRHRPDRPAGKCSLPRRRRGEGRDDAPASRRWRRGDRRHGGKPWRGPGSAEPRPSIIRRAALPRAGRRRKWESWCAYTTPGLPRGQALDPFHDLYAAALLLEKPPGGAGTAFFSRGGSRSVRGGVLT